MTDKDAIQQAYEATLSELYGTMFESYSMAADDSGKLEKADAAFRNGVQLARDVRDKAIGLL